MSNGRKSNVEQIGLYALEWGGRILILGGTSEIAGCAVRESKHLTHCLPECVSLIRLTEAPLRSEAQVVTRCSPPRTLREECWRSQLSVVVVRTWLKLAQVRRTSGIDP
jgi:hypothetical protein